MGYKPGFNNANSELIIDQFVYYLSKHLSQRTVDLYQSHLRGFILYFDPQTILNLSKSDIQEYLKGLKEKRSANIAAGALSCLRKFYIYLNKEKITDNNPTSIAHVQVERKRRELSKAEKNKVQNAIMTANTETKEMFFARVIYWSGMSVSEFCSLKVEDLKYEHGHPILMIRNERKNSVRSIPIPDTIGLEIQTALDNRKKSGLVSSYLFPTIRGKKYLRGNVYKEVKKVLQTLCSREMGPRKLRESFVMEILKHPKNINAMKTLINVRYAESLSHFVPSDLQRVSSIHKQFHPKA